jgi:hypothetical protein
MNEEMVIDPNSLAKPLPTPDSVAAFAPISLQGLDKVKLMNRVDSKYIFHHRELDGLLTEISAHYSVLEIEGKRLFDYASLYFDTPGYDLYRHHHNGKPNRVKLRYRHYLNTGDVFFEVKKKIKGMRTDKFRIRQATIGKDISPEGMALMDRLQVPYAGMESKTWIYYRRITLAAHDSEERVTIDLDMSFEDMHGRMAFPELVIAEVKQAKLSRNSPIVLALHRRRILDFRISKYSLAVALMVPGIKMNVFKPKIARLNKILNT